MTAEETCQLITAIGTLYSRSGFLEQDAKKMKFQARIWHEMLQDLPYNLAAAAVKAHVAINKFPPSVHEIRQAAKDIVQPTLTGLEAWGQVQAAVQQHGIYGAGAGLASLPPEVRRVVQAIGWREICLSENQDVLRSNFLKLWGTESQRDNDRQLLPPAVAQEMGRLAGKMAQKLLNGPGGE